MPKHSSPPTVVDVAAAADVAIGTVSRVLNTPDSVRPDIQQRVLDAIERLKYRRLRQRRAPALIEARSRRRRGNLGILLISMDESLVHLPVITEAIRTLFSPAGPITALTVPAPCAAFNISCAVGESVPHKPSASRIEISPSSINK